MSDPSFEPLKKAPFPIHFVTQTVNNPVSSRCLTAYKIKRSDGRILIIFDAPGNENAADIIRGMFHVNDKTLTDDQLVRTILDHTLETVTNKQGVVDLKGTLPIFGDGSQLSYHDLDSDEMKNMRAKASNELGETRQTFTGFKADPAAFIPGIADRSQTALPENRVKHLSYCKMRVRESLYINLLIGEMTRTLDMSKAQGLLKQVSPFVTVKSAPSSGYKFPFPTRYCVTNEECTISSVRAMYVDDNPPTKPTTLGQEDMDKKHRTLKESNNTSDSILNRVLPIKLLQEKATEIRAVVVVPIGCDNPTQQSIIQNGVKKLSEQLIGRFVV